MGQVSRSAWRGALCGVLTWEIYGVGEAAGSLLWPLLTGWASLVPPSHWELTGWLFLIYGILGALFGGLGGAALEAVNRRQPSLISCQRVAAFGLAAAFVFNAVANFGSLEARAWLTLGVGIAVLVLVSIPRLPIVVAPWVVAALLIQAPFLTSWKHLAMMAAVALGSWLLLDKWDSVRVPWRSWLTLAAAVPLVLIPARFLADDPANLSAPRPSTSAAADKPNVVIVVWDTVRAENLSLYGYERDTTPTLRRMAGTSSVYTRAIATSNYTYPTHASIFSGLYPRTHGAGWAAETFWRKQALSDDITTLAEALGGAGYRSLAVAANYFFFEPQFGLDQGFHLFDRRPIASPLPLDRRHQIRYSAVRLLGFTDSCLLFDQRWRRADSISASAGALLDQVDGSPFFLFLNYMDSHDPFHPPAPYDRLYPGRDSAMNLRHYRKLVDEVREQGRTITAAERAHYLSQYDGGIAYLDSYFDWLIEALRERGLYENTLIILTSDHGESIGEHSMMNHGRSLYQTEVHVPLLIKFPGQQKGESVDALTSHVDLMPTVLDVTGARAPDALQGISLVTPSGDSSRYVVTEDISSRTGRSARNGQRSATWAVFHENLKLILPLAENAEVYDLAADPAEQTDLYPNSSDELQAMLDEWMKTVPRNQNTSSGTLSPESIDNLKALGYLK